MRRVLAGLMRGESTIRGQGMGRRKKKKRGGGGARSRGRIRGGGGRRGNGEEGEFTASVEWPGRIKEGE